MNSSTVGENNIQSALAKKQEKPSTPAQIMQSLLSHEGTKKILENALHENAGAFSASVIDLYNSDKTLQACDPRQVFGECLKAVSLKLPINKQLGFAYVIPYKDSKTGTQVPQFQMGYKGFIQLCMRSGIYKYINAGVVYEGELQTVDKLTGAVDLNGNKVSDEVVGYFAYMETINGFSKAYFWTKDATIKHAAKYSKSYRSGSSIWRDNLDEMCVKTVLRNMLSKWGAMTVDMERALTSDTDDYADKTQDPLPTSIAAEAVDGNVQVEDVANGK